jgi:hypothetical protein
MARSNSELDEMEGFSVGFVITSLKAILYIYKENCVMEVGDPQWLDMDQGPMHPGVACF